MTCAPTDRIMQTLRVHVPGATDPMIELELFNVIDEFCRRTSAWLYEQDVDLQADTLQYDLAVPPDSVVVRLMKVTHNGAPVPSTTSVSAVTSGLGAMAPEETFPDGDASFPPALSDLSGNIFSFAVYRPEFITLTSVPDAEGRQYPMKVVAALSIARSCLEEDCGDWALPEWMYDMYFQDWLDGTLGRMYAMLSKPWSSRELTLYHAKRFRNAMALRKQEAVRGFTYNTPAWRFPRGGWV